MARKGWTLAETKIRSEMKKINSRIKQLFDYGKKSGNYSLYNKYVEGLKTVDNINKGLVHEKDGRLVITESPWTIKKAGQTGENLKRKVKTIPTLTIIRKA